MPRCAWLIAFLVLSARAQAETPQELFKSGNAAYAAGKFSEAAPFYEAARKQGLQNWALAYNLGNAFYKSGHLGEAIVNYHRALRLNPGQRDVMYNLGLASTQAGDPLLPAGALPALFWQIFFFFSLNTLTVIVSVLFVFLCVMGGMALYAPMTSSPAGSGRGSMDPRQWPSGVTVATIFSFVLASIWLGTRIYLLEKPVGAVVASVAEVRSGPNTTYPANFTIPEGRRVLILKEQEPIQGWLEIGVPQEGLKGWVPESAVEII